MVAGLGGLLYGMDIGIIGSALPYLQATSRLTAAELSMIVAVVMLGAVFSTLFAGMLADWMGRKPLMILSGLTFVVSIPMIALSHGYAPLFFGRLLEGVSAGLIGVVIPLYLAECLAAQDRGKGTGVFQWLPTSSMVFAALLGIYFSYHVAAVAKTGDASALFLYKDHAWRNLFWVALPPGILFVLGCLLVTESPRWLFKRGKKEQAHAALLRSRTAAASRRRVTGDGRVGAEGLNAQLDRQEDSGLAPAPQVCGAVPAGLHHSLLQHGHGRQLRSSAITPASCCKAASPTSMPTGAMSFSPR